MITVDSYSQIDPGKRDSLARLIDSAAKASKIWQDRFQEQQDSVYHSSLKPNENDNKRKKSVVKADQRSGKSKTLPRTIILVSIGLSLIVLLFAVLLKNKQGD